MAGWGLALHTTTPELGMAIAALPETGKAPPGAFQPRVQVLDLGRGMASLLHPSLAGFLEPQSWTDLAFLAVAAGPGGFTGTRMGMVTARTLAQQLGLPLFPVSTLAAVAQRWADEQGCYGVPIALEMRAQRDQRFVALYRCGSHDEHDSGYPGGTVPPEVLLADQVMDPADWEAWLARESAAVGAVRVEAETALAASVVQVLAIAQGQFLWGDRPDWAAALPFYGQHPVVVSGK